MPGSQEPGILRVPKNLIFLKACASSLCSQVLRALQEKPQERWVMTAEKFLMADPKPPIDEEEIREAVWELLFSRAPPALVRVVGKQVYHR